MSKKIRIQAQVQYELDRLLGAGGGGEVYSAWRFADEGSPRRKVAVKLVHATLDSEQLSQLHNEAQILSGITNPHVVQVLGIEKIDKDAFALVMELVEGTTLSTWLKNIPQNQGSEFFWRLGLHLLRGFDDLHRRKIVHGDLSPRNILVSTAGFAKIVDFGLSTLRSSAITKQLQGTRGYLSERRLLGDSALPQDDLFALGCVLYECLFNEKLFLTPKLVTADSLKDILSKNERLAQNSAETKILRDLLCENREAPLCTHQLLKKFEDRFLSFPHLPVIQTEVTETLHLKRKVMPPNRNPFPGALKAAGFALLVCAVPSLTKTSVAIQTKVSGSAVINAKPWAHVYLDGQRLGETPIFVPKLRAGFHKVDFLSGEKKKTVWLEVYPHSSAKITQIF